MPPRKTGMNLYCHHSSALNHQGWFKTDGILDLHAQIRQGVGVFLQIEKRIIAGWRDWSRIPLVSTITHRVLLNNPTNRSRCNTRFSCPFSLTKPIIWWWRQKELFAVCDLRCGSYTWRCRRQMERAEAGMRSLITNTERLSNIAGHRCALSVLNFSSSDWKWTWKAWGLEIIEDSTYISMVPNFSSVLRISDGSHNQGWCRHVVTYF